MYVTYTPTNILKTKYPLYRGRSEFAHNRNKMVKRGYTLARPRSIKEALKYCTGSVRVSNPDKYLNASRSDRT